MRIRVLLAAVAASALAAPALAADLGAIEPMPPAPQMEPVSTVAPTWSGFYIGALLGYTWGETDTNAARPLNNVDVDGIDGGVYVGGNVQLDQFVVGLEGDILASGVRDDTAGVNIRQDWSGSLRARAGIALDNFLLYGTAGGAMTNVKMTAGGASDDHTLMGWTAGVGAEALVTDNITARVEYRYTDYENKTFNLGTPVRGDLSTHSVRAGVGFKF